MEERTGHPQLTADIIARLNKGLKKDEVVAELLKDGHEEYFVQQLVTATVKMRNSKLTAEGLKLVLIGAAVCLTSCILALTSTGNFHLVMYGMTTAGIIVVFAGLTKIF